MHLTFLQRVDNKKKYFFLFVPSEILKGLQCYYLMIYCTHIWFCTKENGTNNLNRFVYLCLPIHNSRVFINFSYLFFFFCYSLVEVYFEWDIILFHWNSLKKYIQKNKTKTKEEVYFLLSFLYIFIISIS